MIPISGFKARINIFLLKLIWRSSARPRIQRIIPDYLYSWATMAPCLSNLQSKDVETVLNAIRQVILGPDNLLDLDGAVLSAWAKGAFPNKVLTEYEKIILDSVSFLIIEEGSTQIKQMYSFVKYLHEKKQRYIFNLYFVRFVNIFLLLSFVIFTSFAINNCFVDHSSLRSLLSGAASLTSLLMLFVVKPFERMHSYTLKIDGIEWLYFDISTQWSAIHASPDVQTRAEKVRSLCTYVLKELKKYR